MAGRGGDAVIRPAWLVLEDGTRFAGELVQPPKEPTGEVVFNTALTGYQEVLTDPSYAGQIVVFTYPLIGSYGVQARFSESDRPAARTMVVRELKEPSHAASETTLRALCERRGIGILAAVDTRALTRKLRSQGTLRGTVTDDASRLVEAARRARALDLADIVARVSTPAPYAAAAGRGPRVALIDYGLKVGIVDELRRRGAAVTVFPSTLGADALDRFQPDGVVLSNGPGNPEDLADRLDTVRAALARYPTLGICLGHQLVAMAVGGRTYALKFGHHGSNHPVLDRDRRRIQITAQNHGYAVDGASLPNDWRVRFVNLHDQTVEGLQHETRPVLTVQHHPEGGPGPHDAGYVFDEFMDLMAGRA